VSGLKTGDTIRLATLDSYTGKLWNVTGPKTSTDGSGTFNLVGRTLPEPTFITPVVRKDVIFTIDTYKDFWLPSVGYPTSLDFTAGAAKTATDSLRYNDSTGTAVLTTGLVKGDSYTMTAEEQKVISADDLAKDPTATVNLPPVVGSPDIVTSKAQEFAGKAATPIAQLEAIRLALVQKGFLSHGRASDQVASRAGHGADRISELLERPQMIGDQEQYASGFALMARSFNYPARVVMGFAPKIAEGQKSVKVTGNDVTAWVEVAFDKVGWVAFNPTPKETNIPQAQVPKPQSIPQPQVRQPPRSEKSRDDLLTPVELEKQKKDDKGLLFSLPGWVYILALSILIPGFIVFVPMLIIAAAKRRRARRRRAAARSEDRVAGAWAELLDQYSELGYSVIGKTTRVHIADDLEQQVAQPTMLRSLAMRTDEAVFSGRPVDDQTTERVWTEASASIEAARETVTGLRRFLSRYRVRKARDWALRMATKKEKS
jgi:hypothetical protein